MADEQAPETTESTPATEQAAGATEKSDRTMGMICHLLALCGFVGIPFGNILGPLIMWLVKKDESEFVNDQGKESLNFQITMTIAAIVLGVLTCFLAGLGALVVIIVDLVFVIIAAVKANGGERYRYPLTIRMIK